MDALIVHGRAPHQMEHARALAQGLRRHGVTVFIEQGQATRKADFVACWGWRLGKQLREAGREVLVMERGYLGDRMAWSSLAWNGLNGRGQMYLPTNVDHQRFDTHHPGLLQPWRTGGRYVLLLGQVPGDMSLQGRDLTPWYQAAAEDAARATGLPVFFRPHPVALERGFRQSYQGATLLAGSLQAALAEAACCVTFNSNSAVDAVLAGVPTVAADQGSMAWHVTSRSARELVRPDRRDWAHALAWCQWTLPEIAAGEFWEHLREHLHAPVKAEA